MEGRPNGLTLDTLQISYDRLPDGIEERVATLTLTDSISTYEIQVIQNMNGASAITRVASERASIYPTIFDNEFTVRVPENTHSISVLDGNGRVLYQQPVAPAAREVRVDASAWTQGTYFVRVVRENEATVIRGMKR